jgi:EmrB/QacA subfamily drug resistance transporter
MTLNAKASKATAQDVPLKKGLILLACCLGQFMSVFDASVLNVALPTIDRALHFTPTTLHWVVNAFIIPAVGLVLLAGRLSDLYGQRKVFLTGIAVFTLASLVGGLANSAAILLIGRALQGAGSAIMVPATLTVLNSSFTDAKERGKAIGLWSGASGVGGAVGVLCGGVITEWLSWRWVLLVNVPVGIILYLVAVRSVPERRNPNTKTTLDLVGAISVTAGIVALVYGVAQIGTHGWHSIRVTAPLVASVVLLAFFVYDQKKLAKYPMVPLSTFRNRSLTYANLVMLCDGLALTSTFYFFTLTLQQVLGYSPLRTGLAYIPLALGVLVGAGGIAAVIPKTGPRPAILGGLTAATVGLWWMSRIGEHSSFIANLLGPGVLVGVGIGVVLTGAATAGTANLPAFQEGLGSGLLNTTERLGGAVGLAILVAISTSRTTHLAGHHANAATALHALSAGYSWAFIGTAIFLGAGLIPALAIPRTAVKAGP